MDHREGRNEPVHVATLSLHIMLELSQQPTLSQERLARRLDVTRQTACCHLDQLEAEGYLQINRTHKPFHYTIDWSCTLPTLPQLRLVLFHPEVTLAVQRFSDAAAQVYELALQEQREPTEVLRQLSISHLSA